MPVFTEAYVRELRDEAKRHRIQARRLERALIRETLAARAGVAPDTISDITIDALSVDKHCRVHGLDAALSLPSI